MPKVLSRSVTRSRSQQQGYVLMILGIICLIAAWLAKYNPYTYPIGVLLLGIGLLIAAFFNPARLIIAASLVTAIGIAVFLTFKHLIPGGQVLAAYILAIGIGLLAIAFAARRGYVGKGAMMPAIIVIIVGIIEALLAAGLTPANFVPFMLSLWLPGAGLLILGITYLLASRR